ncbi:hypothetical protein Ciccas_014216 [Cichlidogyrus casuarinus]|uniref:Uncharacterized protein n=1 Tax=Cichlidogyrus casuarinus TaxID=1844966 RepID=A0ABD2PIS2_9PLAT
MAQVVMEERVDQMFRMPQHFFKHDPGLVMCEIPGHVIVEKDDIIETHAHYVFKTAHNEFRKYMALVRTIW